MALRTDTFDLSALRLTAGEGRRLDLHLGLDSFELAGETYMVEPELLPARIDVSRTTGDGYALRLRFDAALVGPCMRCLQPAAPAFAVDAREIWQPGGIEELESPYLQAGALDLKGWARVALALALPAQIVCRPDCAGLCPVCGADLNQAGDEHHHDPEPDPRWAKLAELRID